MENIEAGTYILIGFYHLASDASAGKPTLVSWFKFDVNLETIDTKKMKITLRKPPLVLDTIAKEAPSDDVCLVVEVSLSRRLYQFSMEAVRANSNRSVPTTLTLPTMSKKPTV